MRTPATRLAPQQCRTWLLEENEVESPLRVEARVRLEGALDSDALLRILDELVVGNEALRLAFERTPGEALPTQWSRPAVRAEQRIEDLGALAPAEQELALARLTAELGEAATNRSEQRPFRCALVRLGPSRHVLALAVSALCGDRVTLEHLVALLAEGYGRRGTHALESTPRPSTEVGFARCAEVLAELHDTAEAAARARAWHARMFAAPRVLKLPFAMRSPETAGFTPRTRRCALDPAAWRALRRHPDLAPLRPEAVLFAAWRVLLWRLTGEADVVLGHLSAGRVFEEMQRVLGPFDKFVPIALTPDPEATFADTARAAERLLDEADDEVEYFSWEALERVAGGERISPAYLPLTFDYHARPAPLERGGVTFTLEALDGCIDRLDLGLSCEVVEDELVASLRFNAEVFEAADIERLGDHLVALLGHASQAPRTPIRRLELLTEAQRHQLVVEFNATDLDAPRGVCIHQLIQEQARRTPSAPAVFFEDQELSYGELDARSNRLARYLRGRGVGPDVFVAIHAEPSLEMVVAILAILKAGGAYVPLDPEYPDERLQFMLADTRAPVLLTQHGLKSIEVPDGVHVLDLDRDWEQVAGESAEALEDLAGPEHLAYSIYTSGSTGQPKGVLITHANLVHSTHARVVYYGGKVGRYLLLSSFAFDSSVAGIFWTLMDGGALVLPVAGTQRDPRKINDLMARRRVTHSLCLASHYALILSQGRAEAFAALETAIVSGEVFSTALVERHDALAPGARLFNEYGPTEGSVWSIVFDCHDPVVGNQVPIGRPIANTRIYLLDRLLQPVPIGVPGEIFQGGAGVTNGYLNRPELTAEAFLPDPFSGTPGARMYKSGDLARYLPDGNIEFIGRIDHQVKLRGYRIELGEIEAVLGKHPAVREVAVLCREDEPGDKRLVAYYACQPGRAAVAHELREHLAQKLPEYMLPAAFVQLDALPRTSIGKLEPSLLEPPASERPDVGADYVAPRNPLEQVVADVWASELGRDRVGVHDNFFELGGHSLVAVRIVYRLRDTLDVELALRGIFDEPTVAGLAELLLADPGQRARVEQVAQLASLAASLAAAELTTTLEEQTHDE